MISTGFFWGFAFLVMVLGVLDYRQTVLLSKYSRAREKNFIVRGLLRAGRGAVLIWMAGSRVLVIYLCCVLRGANAIYGVILLLAVLILSMFVVVRNEEVRREVMEAEHER